MRLGRGELYAALAAMCFGSAYVATAFALRSFAPLPAAVDRSLLAAVALWILVLGRRSAAPADGPRPSRATRFVHLAVLGILGGAIFLAGMNNAVAGVGPTIAAFVAGLYAILAALFAPVLLRESLRVRALVGFGLALLGTALLAELRLEPSDVIGLGWGLIAAVSFALFLVLSRRWGRADGLDGARIALAAMAISAAVLGVVVLATDPAALVPASPKPEALVALAWLVVAAAAGQTLSAASVRLLPASRTAAFLLLNPLTAAVLSIVLLGLVPTPLQLLGGGLVLVGMAAATIPPGARLARAGAAAEPASGVAPESAVSRRG